MGDKCEAYRVLIEEAADRGAEHAPALGAHLGACAPCREFRRERAALLELLGGLEKVDAPDDFEFRLRARIARQRAAEKSLLRRLRFAPGLASAAVAACLLAAAALYFRAPLDANNNQVAARPDAPAAPVSNSVAEAEAARHNQVAAVNPEQNGPGERAVEEQDKPQRRARVAEEKASAQRPRRASREDNFGVRTAPVVDVSKGRQLASHSETQGVALRTSPETLRVVLRDARGESYVLPMRSVSFGAQGPVGHDARAVRASYADKEGVW
jgi:hypothetical protein